MILMRSELTALVDAGAAVRDLPPIRERLAQLLGGSDRMVDRFVLRPARCSCPSGWAVQRGPCEVHDEAQ